MFLSGANILKVAVPLAVALAVADAMAAPTLELPVWEEDDESRYNEPGSALLGGGLWPLELQPTPVTPFEDVVAEAEGTVEPEEQPEEMTRIEVPRITIIRGDDWTRNPAAANLRGNLGPRGEVPAEFHAAYFGERLPAKVINPQQLLSGQNAADLQRFLEYHEEESAIPIHVLIFGGRQDMPSDITLKELHRRWFGTEHAVIAAFFLGEPNRSQLEFGGRWTEIFGAVPVRDVRDRCIDEAGMSEDFFNQIERFCIELSIRLYWIEKKNGLAPDNADLEVADLPSTHQISYESFGDRLRSRIDLGAALGYLAGLVIGLSALAAVLWKLLRRPGRTCVFPDFELSPRLHAPHSGGAHAVMFFGQKERT